MRTVCKEPLTPRAAHGFHRLRRQCVDIRNVCVVRLLLLLLSEILRCMKCDALALTLTKSLPF